MRNTNCAAIIIFTILNEMYRYSDLKFTIKMRNKHLNTAIAKAINTILIDF